ncbi:C6 zinc cluster transcription factor-like protein [Purpureocillium takamizusanense]|uniref:C6 zinc cluster transcription factor-like protein n=1 Tax=Purpureocillium takamizusanense TaxID=2060973 RepID=A0A9Q8Q8I1_9HYPO|nr:C6 zinc cluster transcription factor-like protein [Purpureocillium takamizusanense]UNI14347.1 C6 zinc cluster transcription factor-like protein [Purpureocillium takamizusanense]
MPLEKIYVTRHGFRSNWLVDPATGAYHAYLPSPTGIPADPTLTSHGVKQSRELAKHLMTLDPPIDAVYSSPFYRCLETLKPFVDLAADEARRYAESERQAEHPTQTPGESHPGEHLSVRQEDIRPLSWPGANVAAKIRPEHGIQEWFGSAPFDHPRPATTAVLKSLFPAIDETYQSTVVPSSRGETLAELQLRVAVALKAIIDSCDADGTRAVLLCTHAAVVIVLGRILTGQAPVNVEDEDFYAYTCGLSVYSRQPALARGLGDSCRSPASSSSSWAVPVAETESAGLIGGWNCELNSDCSFLSGGAERGWKFAGDESFPGTGSLSQGEPKL